MSAKKKDDKNRWRNLTVAFRMSPEEKMELEKRIKLLGFQTKREYIAQALLKSQVVAYGNPLMFVTFRKELQGILMELKRISSTDEIDEELFTSIRTMLEILESFQKEKTSDESKE